MISRATVKTYVTRILSKLGLTDRVQAVVLGYETGLIRPGPLLTKVTRQRGFTKPATEERLDGTDHATHKEQASMIRRYIIWRNNHAYDERLRRIVDRANVA
jgi:hypothetical protein